MASFNNSQTFEGKLNKRGKVNKAWKERWFVLDEHEQRLEYYPTQKDANENQRLSGTIDLILIQKIEIIHSYIDGIKLKETESLKNNKSILSKFIIANEKPKSNKSYSFQLILPSRTYTFSALDSKSYIGWLNELCRIIYGEVVYEGNVKVLSGKVSKKWKSKYFTLNKYKQLKYYKDKTRNQLLGIIDLNVCNSITNGKSYGSSFKFTIQLQTPQKKWIICPGNKQEKVEWEKMIKAVKYEKMDDKSINENIKQNLNKHHANIHDSNETVIDSVNSETENKEQYNEKEESVSVDNKSLKDEAIQAYTLWFDEVLCLPQYHDAFIKAGYENLSFLDEDINEDILIKLIKVNKKPHRKKILNEIIKLVESRNKAIQLHELNTIENKEEDKYIYVIYSHVRISKEMMTSTELIQEYKSWFDNILGLPQYCDAFIESGYQNLSFFDDDINEKFLTKEIKVKKKPHIKKILNEVRKIVNIKNDNKHSFDCIDTPFNNVSQTKLQSETLNQKQSEMYKATQEYKQWFNQTLGLPQYYDMFVDSGYEILGDLDADIDEDFLTKEFKIKKKPHKKRIVKEIKKLIEARNVSSYVEIDENNKKAVQEFKAWFNDVLCLPQYYESFINAGYEILDDLYENLDEKLLTKYIKINKKPHIKRILREISKLQMNNIDGNNDRMNKMLPIQMQGQTTENMMISRGDCKYQKLKKMDREFRKQGKSVTICIGMIAQLIVATIETVSTCGMFPFSLGAEIMNGIKNFGWNKTKKISKMKNQFYEQGIYVFIEIDSRIESKENNVVFWKSKKIEIIAKTKIFYVEAGNKQGRQKLEEQVNKTAIDAFNYIQNPEMNWDVIETSETDDVELSNTDTENTEIKFENINVLSDNNDVMKQVNIAETMMDNMLATDMVIQSKLLMNSMNDYGSVKDDSENDKGMEIVSSICEGMGEGAENIIAVVNVVNDIVNGDNDECSGHENEDGNDLDD